MYAIIATGGKQYKVAEGDIIKVEKLNVEEGKEVSFDVVAVSTDSDMLCGDACKNSSVKATVLGDGKALSAGDSDLVDNPSRMLQAHLGQ